MLGARGIVIASLVLAAVAAAPALSVAQDASTQPAASPPPAAPPPDPVQPATPTAPPAEDAGEQEPKQQDKGRGDQGPAEKQAADPAPAAPAAASPPAPASSEPVARVSATAQVSIGDNFYSPATVSIAVGDTLTWQNNGQAQHSATANDGSFDTGVFGPGGSRSHTFNTAGTFQYFCTVHGQAQSGTVRVLAAAGGGGGGGGGAGTGGGGGSGAAGTSEAAAVSSPDAAGTSTSLPSTGLAAGVLALIGIAMIAGGHALRRLDPERGRSRRLRFFSPF